MRRPKHGGTNNRLDVSINYKKLACALVHLKENPDCLLLATNRFASCEKSFCSFFLSHKYTILSCA